MVDVIDDPVTSKVAVSEVLGRRQLWAFASGKLLTDPIWWFYLFWLPKFLAQEHDIRGTALIPYLTSVYIIADFGSVMGGYLSSTLIKRGWTVNAARKTTMGIFASMITFVIIAGQTRSAWLAVALIGMGTPSHQAWCGNAVTIS